MKTELRKSGIDVLVDISWGPFLLSSLRSVRDLKTRITGNQLKEVQ